MMHLRSLNLLLGLSNRLGVLIFVGLLALSFSLKAESIQEDLDATTEARDTLKGDVKNMDIKLDGARKRLQDLIRSQAPLTDIQVQKERIRDIQDDKLKLLTNLLALEEKRAELLVKYRMEEQAKAEAAAKEVPPEDATQPDKTATTEPTKDGGKTTQPENVSVPEFAESTAALVQYSSLIELKEALAKLKTDRGLLKGEYDGLTARIELTQGQLDALGAEGDEAQRKALATKISSYSARRELVSKRLGVIDNELDTIQTQFESFVKAQGTSDYVMPGQKLELTVVEDKSFNGKYIVKPGGYILLPRIGRVTIAGKSRQEAEKTVKEALESTQLRIATVLLEPASLDDPEEERREMELELLKAKTKYYSGEKSDIGQDVIYLTGAFKRQGPWVIPKGFQPTLLTTLIRSGWVGADADLTKVRVLRMVNGKSITESVDVQAMMAGTPGIMDVKLSPSDVIIVPTASRKQKQTIYLTGNVKVPGPHEVSFEKPVTAYTAILNAGGFTRFANLSDVFILRDTGGEKKERIEVNMSKVKNGEIPDPELQPNDIVVVPESFWGMGN